MEQKQITQIHLGVVDGKIGWSFTYEAHPTEAFALHVPIARQFMQSLQELVLYLEQAQRPAQGTLDGIRLGDAVTLQLHPPTAEE